MRRTVIDAWVMNASPIILYARAGRLDLIEQLASNIIVPDKVIAEIAAGKDMTANIGANWAAKYRIADIQVQATVEHWDIGIGESQVISLCLGTKRWSVLDDRMARRCAHAHNIPVIGSLGIVIRAKTKGIITKARPFIEKLKESGLYADDDLIARVLSAIGES